MRRAHYRRMTALSLLAGVLGSAGCIHYHYHDTVAPGCGDGAVIQYGAPGAPVTTDGVTASSRDRTVSSRVTANPLDAQADPPPNWRSATGDDSTARR